MTTHTHGDGCTGWSPPSVVPFAVHRVIRGVHDRTDPSIEADWCCWPGDTVGSWSARIDFETAVEVEMFFAGHRFNAATGSTHLQSGAVTGYVDGRTTIGRGHVVDVVERVTAEVVGHLGRR